ncbi:MAG: hypothetical protein ABL918_03300 [Chakrabartia sp.]
MGALVRIFVGCAFIGHALTFPAYAEGQDKKKIDLNEMVCRSDPILGSRLAKRRTCMTRAQWIEQRALDRQSIERVQRSACGTLEKSNC